VSAREVGVAATVTVGHRAVYGRPCGDGFAVVSAEGEMTVVDRELRVVRQFELGGPVGDFAVSADGTTWAWTLEDQLWIGTPDGPGRTSAPLAGEVACRWLPSQEGLWVAVGTGAEVRVEIREPDHRVARQVTVPDRFGDAMVMLCEHPRADAVVLWVAAGQDGQESWLVTDDGTTPRARRLPADGCRPALFGPDGRWLLAADHERLTRLSWPDSTELGALSWPSGSEMPSGDLVLLPGGYVSWGSDNGRVRIIDLAAMAVVDEITLAGHPLRTIAERYPTLVGDETPCTDFGYSVTGADGLVLTVHQRNTLVLSASQDWAPS
jgi:hypothetical protein